jgi:D-sedoheptulose 7-phosphate isomerase
MDRQAKVVEQLGHAIELKRALQKDAGTLLAIADMLTNAFRKGNKLLIFGNGGSAADAQHIASELTGRFHLDRPPLPAMALTTDTSSLTAIANDFGYETVFARQVRAFTRAGDVVIGISTSGGSPNVLRGIREAKECGAVTVALTGQGGELATMADLALRIPSRDTPRIQEAHITAGHIICCLVEEALFGNG